MVVPSPEDYVGAASAMAFTLLNEAIENRAKLLAADRLIQSLHRQIEKGKTQEDDNTQDKESTSPVMDEQGGPQDNGHGRMDDEGEVPRTAEFRG